MVEDNKLSEEEKLNLIFSKIQSHEGLDEKELEIIKNSSNLTNEVKTHAILLDKQNKGQKLKPEEISFLKEQERRAVEQETRNQRDLGMPVESLNNLKRFEQEASSAKFQINHITDLHSPAKDFEAILLNNLISKGHLVQKPNGVFEIKDGVAVAITGDLIPDFFDIQREGLETYLSSVIVKKADFTKEEAKEFVENYKKLMEFAGLDESMILENHRSLRSEQSPLNLLVYGYLYGGQDPQFLSEKQKKEFKKIQAAVQRLLKKGIKNYTTKEYSKIKEILEKNNLTPDKVVMVSGNHDVPDVFNEILGDYALTPGKVKTVAGINFGNIVQSANGNFTGAQDFNDTFGYAGLREEVEALTYKTEPFIELKKHLAKSGIEFEDKELKRYIDNSIQRATRGIGTGHLGNYFKTKIKPLLEKHLENRIKDIEKNIPKGADVILNHSVLDLAERAGLEEIAAHNLLVKQKKKGEKILVLGGHEHGQTSHKREDIYHLNPGSALAGNSAVHLLDKDKKYTSSLFASLDENSNQIYKHLRYNEIPVQSAQRVKQ